MDHNRDQDIFISYSRTDEHFVSNLIESLKSHGMSVWIDKHQIRPGTLNWDQAIRDAIGRAKLILLVASPASRRSNFVQDELSIAEMYKRVVIPVWASGDEWIDCIPLGMGKVQYIDLRKDAYASGLNELIAALKGKLGSLFSVSDNQGISHSLVDVSPTPRNDQREYGISLAQFRRLIIEQLTSEFLSEQ